MKKAAALAIAGSALALTWSFASAQPDGARPDDGVAASAWTPSTSDAGFVVTGSNSELVRRGGATPTVTDFGGFVPKAKFMARFLADTYYRCHTPGAVCGHEDYVDLIPSIMADKDHDRDSWAARMEQQLKAHFDVAPSEIHVEQIHCGDIGCFIELTQKDNGRAYKEQYASNEDARAALTDEPWFQQQFFASYEDSHFTGDITGFPVDPNMTEALWIFARKAAAARASGP